MKNVAQLLLLILALSSLTACPPLKNKEGVNNEMSVRHLPPQFKRIKKLTFAEGQRIEFKMYYSGPGTDFKNDPELTNGHTMIRKENRVGHWDYTDHSTIAAIQSGSLTIEHDVKLSPRDEETQAKKYRTSFKNGQLQTPGFLSPFIDFFQDYAAPVCIYDITKKKDSLTQEEYEKSYKYVLGTYTMADGQQVRALAKISRVPAYPALCSNGQKTKIKEWNLTIITADLVSLRSLYSPGGETFVYSESRSYNIENGTQEHFVNEVLSAPRRKNLPKIEL